MDFEWDDAKSDACFRERGFDFEYVAQAFFDPARHVMPDDRHAYGEDRFRLLGRIDGRLFVVVYTPRAGALRIISALKANAREVKRYDGHPQEDH